MKIVVAGNSIILTSELKLEDLVLIKKLCPDALTIYDGETPVFTISPNGTPGINQYGACFRDVARDGSGKACITIEIPEDVENVQEFVLDMIGSGISYIEELETVLPGKLDEINSRREYLLRKIEIV